MQEPTAAVSTTATMAAAASELQRAMSIHNKLIYTYNTEPYVKLMMDCCIYEVALRRSARADGVSDNRFEKLLAKSHNQFPVLLVEAVDGIGLPLYLVPSLNLMMTNSRFSRAISDRFVAERGQRRFNNLTKQLGKWLNVVPVAAVAFAHDGPLTLGHVASCCLQ